MLNQKIFYILFVCIFLFSCSSNTNTNILAEFIAIEKYLQENENNRIFNPSSAILIATLPNSLGNLKAFKQINNFEVNMNGAGYSKRYKTKEKGYWIDIFTYHLKQTTIPENINSSIAISTYNKLKNDILKNYKNYNILEENRLIFTTFDGNFIEMKQLIFEYYNEGKKEKMISYLYFGINMDSFFRVRVNYEASKNMFLSQENFIKDFAYYYADGMSLSDFNLFKASNSKNLTKMQKE